MNQRATCDDAPQLAAVFSTVLFLLLARQLAIFPLYRAVASWGQGAVVLAVSVSAGNPGCYALRLSVSGFYFI